MKFNTIAKSAAVLAIIAVAPSVMAQTGPDVSAATDAFDSVNTTVGLVGAGMVLAASAGIVWRWVTAFLVK